MKQKTVKITANLLTINLLQFIETILRRIVKYTQAQWIILRFFQKDTTLYLLLGFQILLPATLH